jgi:anti-anti-sigma regulatory factor
MLRPDISISPRTRLLSHENAQQIYSHALRRPGARLIQIDMSRVEETTTSAFARLVLLRQELRREGRDLHLTGLRDRTARLYEVNRLGSVLPCL